MRRLGFLRNALPVALTLSLFLGWLVVGAVHHHADQPGCELCKALHNGVADASRPAPTVAPRITAERVALIPAVAPAERSSPHPRGRAPPLA
jgi:hypothetical protein